MEVLLSREYSTKVSIKKVTQEDNEIFILKSVGLSVDFSNKKIIENQLKDYAYHNLFPEGEISIFSSIEKNTASITVIKSLNSLNEEIIHLP